MQTRVYLDRGEPFDFRDMDAITARATAHELSDEHATASYGLPVLVLDGVAHGPGDLTGCALSMHWDEPIRYPTFGYDEDGTLFEAEIARRDGLIAWARAGGWQVEAAP